jgi:3-oxoadipate enol-lactonase
VDVEGGQLYFERAGTGPALVWIHAAIADHRMWNREFVQYAARNTVVRYDVRGLGRSTPATAPYVDTDDLLAVLDSTGIDRATLIGCSNGGRISIDFALAHPDRVDRLVLVAPGLGGFEFSGDPEEKAAFERSDERFKPIMAAYKAGEKEAAIAGLREFWCGAVTGPTLELVTTMLRDNLTEVFTDASSTHAIRPLPPAATRLGSITAPTLVLLGDRDADESRFFVDRVRSGIPGAKKEPIPGADHLINLSRPREFDQAVQAFLAESR